MRFIYVHSKNEHVVAIIICVLLGMIKFYFHNFIASFSIFKKRLPKILIYLKWIDFDSFQPQVSLDYLHFPSVTRGARTQTQVTWPFSSCSMTPSHTVNTCTQHYARVPKRGAPLCSHYLIKVIQNKFHELCEEKLPLKVFFSITFYKSVKDGQLYEAVEDKEDNGHEWAHEFHQPCLCGICEISTLCLQDPSNLQMTFILK